MCFAKAPKIPEPVQPPRRMDAAQIADTTRKRLSVRQGYASTIKTSLSGDPAFGRSAQMAGLSAGTATKLGVAA